MQRTRDFNRYEDLDDRYELRPSGWVETRGDWGKDHVELIEIPTPDETNDNIVAFWSPEKQPEPGQSLDLEYRLHFSMDAPRSEEQQSELHSLMRHSYAVFFLNKQKTNK